MTTRKMSQLIHELNDKSGIDRVAMSAVRDACGWERIRATNVGVMVQELDDAGLGFLPPCDSLPTDRNATVWLYVKASDVGRLIEVVLNPDLRGVKRLRARASGSAARKVAKIAAILEGGG